MASGHVNRTKRPNTWLHRPSLHVRKSLPTRSRPHMALRVTPRIAVRESLLGAQSGLALVRVSAHLRQAAYRRRAGRAVVRSRCNTVGEYSKKCDYANKCCRAVISKAKFRTPSLIFWRPSTIKFYRYSDVVRCIVDRLIRSAILEG